MKITLHYSFHVRFTNNSLFFVGKLFWYEKKMLKNTNADFCNALITLLEILLIWLKLLGVDYLTQTLQYHSRGITKDEGLSEKLWTLFVARFSFDTFSRKNNDLGGQQIWRQNPPVFTNGNVRYVKWQNMGHWSSFGRGGKMLSFHGCRARNKEFPVERRSGSWDHLPEEFGGSSWLDPSTDGVVDSSFYPQVIQLRPRFDPSFDGICSLKIKTSYDQDLKAAILHFLKRLTCIKWCQLSNIVR